MSHPLTVLYTKPITDFGSYIQSIPSTFSFDNSKLTAVTDSSTLSIFDKPIVGAVINGLLKPHAMATIAMAVPLFNLLISFSHLIPLRPLPKTHMRPGQTTHHHRSPKESSPWIRPTSTQSLVATIPRSSRRNLNFLIAYQNLNRSRACAVLLVVSEVGRGVTCWEG
jgi:hypothetical protein